jgi:hypothetical protein
VAERQSGELALLMLNVKQSIAPGLGEYSIQSALANRFDWNRNKCFPRVKMWSWEQDLVIVTEAGKVWEVEIKTAMQDWRNDFKKNKWTSLHWKKISRFYYCVTPELLKNGIPDWVPGYAGILVASQEFYAKTKTTPAGDRIEIKEMRPAQNRSLFKIEPPAMNRLLISTYFRFWRTQRHDPMSSVFLQAQEYPDELDEAPGKW